MNELLGNNYNKKILMALFKIMKARVNNEIFCEITIRQN